jgi:hypothetical protein
VIKDRRGFDMLHHETYKRNKRVANTVSKIIYENFISSRESDAEPASISPTNTKETPTSPAISPVKHQKPIQWGTQFM